MSNRVIGYTGEGRARRAVWDDEGPSSVRTDPSNIGGDIVRGESERAAILRHNKTYLARKKAAVA